MQFAKNKDLEELLARQARVNDDMDRIWAWHAQKDLKDTQAGVFVRTRTEANDVYLMLLVSLYRSSTPLRTSHVMASAMRILE